MIRAAREWLRAEIEAAAVRLSAFCFAAVLTDHFPSKIILARFVHDEAEVLRLACSRLEELSGEMPVPRSLRDAVGGTAIAFPADVGHASFLPFLVLPAAVSPLSTSGLFDEPTHRVREAIVRVRARQRCEIEAVDAPRGQAGRFGLAKMAAVLRALSAPGRPTSLRLSDERVPVAMDQGRGRAALLQQNLVNLEIPTIELCCSLIIEEADMPLDFVSDMARQAWDEARHATMFWNRLEEVAGRIEDFPASTSLWEMCRGQPLAVRLAIHQCFGEWIGVDGASWYAAAAEEAGDGLTAGLFEAVMWDEMGHVRLGHRWLNTLCATPESKAAARAAAANARAAAGKATVGPLAFPLSEDRCRACGFEVFEVEALAARYGEYGSVAELGNAVGREEAGGDGPLEVSLDV